MTRPFRESYRELFGFKMRQTWRPTGRRSQTQRRFRSFTA